MVKPYCKQSNSKASICIVQHCDYSLFCLKAHKFFCYYSLFFALHQNRCIKSVDLKTSMQINPQRQLYLHQKPSWGQICLISKPTQFPIQNWFACGVLCLPELQWVTLFFTSSVYTTFMSKIHKELFSILMQQLKASSIKTCFPGESVQNIWLNKTWGKCTMWS